MKYALTFAVFFIASGAIAAPLTNERDAIRVGCAIVHAHLPGGDTDCSHFAARLRGDVWTVSEKQSPDDLTGGGAPAVELSEEDGHLLDFDLSE
jgi:hypothetical protein